MGERGKQTPKILILLKGSIMSNAKQMLSVIFSEEIDREIEASNTVEKMKQEHNIKENDIAQHYLELFEKSQKRLVKLYELKAPKMIIDNEYNIMRKYVYVIAVIAFKNTLEVEYYNNIIDKQKKVE